MKLYAEFKDGQRSELKELSGLTTDCEVLVVRSTACWSKEMTAEIEEKLSKKFGKKVVLLDGRFSEILCVPKEG